MNSNKTITILRATPIDHARSFSVREETHPPCALERFVYSTGNIVGCLLALTALGLFFADIIHLYWWAIVAGLYCAAVLAWPPRDSVQVAEMTPLPTDRLAKQAHLLVDSTVSGLPKDAVSILRSIEGTLSELLPPLNQLQDRGTLSVKDCFTVAETVRRYLPDTLGAYLRLPAHYAQAKLLADGRTAAQSLLNQLQVLDDSLKQIAHSAFDGDAQRLVIHERFLEGKFIGEGVLGGGTLASGERALRARHRG